MRWSRDIPALVIANGRLCRNGDKFAQKWFWAAAKDPSGDFPITTLAGGTSIATIEIPSVDNDRGDAEFCYFLLNAGGSAIAVQPYYASMDRKFSNTAIDGRLFFGRLPFPGGFLETVYCFPNTKLQFLIQNLVTTGSTTTSIVGVGRRFLDTGRERITAVRRRAAIAKRTHLFLMGPDTPPASVTAAATATYIMTVPGDMDFQSSQLVDATGQDYNVRIYENGRSNPLMSAEISARDFVFSANRSVTGFPSNIITAGQLPGRVCNFTHLFKRGSKIRVEITMGSVDAAPVFALRGRAIYYGATSKDQIANAERCANVHSVWRPLAERAMAEALRAPFGGGGFEGEIPAVGVPGGGT